ncbi:OprD family outer membrane porin [Acinetobacter apis]|uniref:Outer membrane porin, OprD family n=1 Tax=Acinetobacter apis TaxID=1229165 RepID=A0A217EIG1_9GAMM|nr:OprD family outer membrane porin [Acinetobacter apis]SNQ30000.1 outer membrane porin, OprD family [Acinetobacter apis]
MPELHKRLTLALLVNAVLFSSAYAAEDSRPAQPAQQTVNPYNAIKPKINDVDTKRITEQGEAKGFLEGAKGSVLLRNGWIYRDRSEGRKDLSSWGQTAIGKFETGFTKGLIGFSVGAVGDFSFKLGENKNAGNQVLYANGQKRDYWTRGGANVKARVSNTTVVYGTQFLELPVLASNDFRLTPEYFTGTLVTSHEIKDLELIYGHFTKDQYSDEIATDRVLGTNLKQADIWGINYKFNSKLKAAYYGANFEDKLQRHFIDINYLWTMGENRSLVLDFSGYHTKYDEKIYNSLSFPTGEANTDKTNNIWAASATYNQGPHTAMLTYQQSTGNVGYDYNIIGDGGASIALPNSYLSDYNANGEKSIQAMYSVDFGAYGVPGLKWTTAYLYGWDIRVANVTDNAKEHEFFNQVKYTVQNGFAKDLSFKVRNSSYHAGQDYNGYLGSTSEWRLYLEYPINF